MDVHSYFSQADLEAIRQAVVEVEQKTSGEVVPYVVGASDDYEEASWKGATLGALLAVLGAAIVHEAGGFWGGWFAAWVAAPAVGGAAVGFLVPHLSIAVKRALAGAETLRHRVQSRAEAAFLQEEVFHTRDRTGILIFLSLLERRVVVLGDAGINAKVEQHEWDATVDLIVQGIRAARPAAALIDGIARCGELLTRRGVAIRPDDSDELSDDLRLRDR